MACAYMSAYVYHERQLGALCGVHCLNNLLQGPRFGPGDLAEIGVELDAEERELLTRGGDGEAEPTAAANGSSGGLEGQPYNVDSSADGGNFSIQVLARALERFGLELLPSKHPSARDLMRDPPSAAKAFLCQYKDHWFAIREVETLWWNLNSTRPRPGHISPFYLAAWLAQLGAEGYSIFLVRGADLPEPSEPQTDDSGREENLHEIYELLEKNQAGDDRPIAGGEVADVDPVIPPDTCDPAESESLRLAQALASEGRRSQPHQFGQRAATDASREFKELQNMGFRETQILVACELTRCNTATAANMLLRVKGVDASVENDGARLAQAILDAAQHVDRREGAEDALLELVTLLSLDGAKLSAASRHMNAMGLKELLVSIRSARQQQWSAALVQCTSMAADLVGAALVSGQASTCSGAEAGLAKGPAASSAQRAEATVSIPKRPQRAGQDEIVNVVSL